MSRSSTDIQDLQIFLSRVGAVAPTFGRELPTILAPGPSRDAVSAYISERSVAPSTIEDFPMYLAIANSEAVESVRLPFSTASLWKMLGKLASDELSLRECIDFGTVLFDAVFHHSIRDQLRSLAAQGRALRLTIATSAPELLILPWEILCDTQFGVLPRFLCHDQNIRFCRSLRLFNRAGFGTSPISTEHLRILLVTASPPNLARLDVEKEEAMLRFVLEEAPMLKGVEFRAIHNASVVELRKTLNLFKPHIVHFTCHGSFESRDGMGHIFLASSEQGHRGFDAVNSFRLASLLHEPGSVRFVFLNTCHGAAQDPISTFSGIAECLHANGIPAVAALQFMLFERTAHAITLNLYRHLLRDRLSIEESVTRIRQYLFLNNHSFSECFGLALFQGNSSLVWQLETPTTDGKTATAQGDEDFVRAFEEALKHKSLAKLSTELEKITGKFAELSSLTSADLGLMLNVFGDLEVAITVLLDVKQTGIPIGPFLKLAKLASVLCQETFEQEPITTSILLVAAADFESFLKRHKIEISEKLEPGFYLGEIRKIVSEAIKVNGIERVFAALIKPVEQTKQDAAEWQDECILSLKGMVEAELQSASVLSDPKWKHVLAATKEAGCAFILPERSRIKLIIAGEQVAEYRRGRWSHTNLASLKQALVRLAADSTIDVDLLSDVTRKAIVSSDIGKGRIFVIQQKDGKAPNLQPGYKDISAAHGASELSTKKITELAPMEYLTLIEGDGATILSHEGQTLAVNAKLAPAPDTQVSEIVSAGTRHLSAQKITKESDTIAIVVSDDGPITIFFRGKAFVRKL